MLEEGLYFDTRLGAVLAALEGALGVDFDAQQKERLLRDARYPRGPKRYALYCSRRLRVLGRVERHAPQTFWLQLEGRQTLERTCVEVLQRMDAVAEQADDPREPAAHRQPALRRRELGRSGLAVSALGLGCQRLTEFHAATDERAALAVIRHALDAGIDFLDTADVYGRGANEELVGRAIRGRRDEVVLATKFGVPRTDDSRTRPASGRPEYVRSACDASLRRLGVEHIDLYSPHRVDPAVPIEETVGAMAELVAAGKVRYLGLCEAAPGIIRRAARIHPLAAVQAEYSFWMRDPEREVLPTCRALGIGFVARSPLGRGFLAAPPRQVADPASDEGRREQPQFQPPGGERNLELVRQLEVVAARRDATAAQLALAWLFSRGDDIVPIPGTRRTARIDENTRAIWIDLSAAERAELEQPAAGAGVTGERLSEA